VIGLAGKIPEALTTDMQKYFDRLISISKEQMPIDIALKNTASDLRKTAKELGDALCP